MKFLTLEEYLKFIVIFYALEPTFSMRGNLHFVCTGTYILYAREPTFPPNQLNEIDC